MKVAAVLLSGLALSVTSSSADQGSAAQVLLDENPASYVLLGNMVIKLEGTTFGDLETTIRRVLVTAGREPQTVREGGLICLALKGMEVRFSANVLSMGGQITTYEITEVGEPSRRCIPVPDSLWPVRAGGWLRVGDSRDLVERRLGVPGDRSQPRVTYHFSGFVPMSGPGACTDEGMAFFNSLEVTYVSNKVSRIAVNQGTHC
jgi:hypothetical protein